MEGSVIAGIPWASLGVLIIVIFGVLFIGILLFFALRALWLWYFRINEVVDLLTAIEKHLRAMRPQGKPHTEGEKLPALDSGGDAYWKCSKCGAQNQRLIGWCQKCGEAKVEATQS